jgi:hypothetical protein
MANEKFDRLVREVTVAVRETIGDYNDEFLESVTLEILARVYSACPNHKLPETDELPTIIVG